MPPSNQMTLKRIRRELADLQKDEAELGSIQLGLVSDANLYLWKGTIPGPEGSPYEGGEFRVDIKLPDDYPFNAPKVTFATRIYHMNIAETGSICIDILKTSWSPALSLFKLMLSLSSLLTDPNPKDPLVPSIATAYVRDRVKHNETARHWTRLYAQPRGPNDPEPPQTPTSMSTLVRRMLPTPIPLAYNYPPGAPQHQHSTYSVPHHYSAPAPSSNPGYYMNIPTRGRPSLPMQVGYASASSSNTSTPSSSIPRASAASTRSQQHEVITIDDSEDELVSSPRRRPAASRASVLTKRRRGESESEVEGLVMDSDRERARGRAEERRVRRRREAVRPPPDGEVIVID
ncbi:ubiquitin-conjugating enzyme/RWD-like protein, partial [Pterulicium gracile]